TEGLLRGLDDAAAIVRREPGERIRALIDLIGNAVAVAVGDLGRNVDRLPHDALADDLALDDPAAERNGDAETDTPLVHAFIGGRLVLVPDVARLAAHADAAAAEPFRHETEPDVTDRVGIVVRLEQRVVAHQAGAEDHERRRSVAAEELVADVEARAVLIVIGHARLAGIDLVH